MTQEFLPLCDVLFNIISLASYFCDVVFDLIMVYTLYDKKQFVWFGIALACIIASLVASQMMSIKWYLRTSAKTQQLKSCDVSFVFIIHLLQSGVLWRYFKLFIPVDLRYVKRAVRDLCLLRLLHAFCEAAPMLLIQLYFMWETQSVNELTQLNIVSAVLSLFSVCWALASFNKHIRQHNLHKLVLTWLGVIYQFMWRLGTVSSRVVALTLYATLYHFWVFLVIGLHWISMFLWLISPKNVFHGEKLSRTKKCVFSLLISYVYIFCYINLQEVNARQKMLAFYITMFLENSLLMTVWLGQQPGNPWFKYVGIAVVWGGFALGILFMMMYYKYFHVKRLQHGHSVSKSLATHSNCTSCQLGTCSEHSERTITGYLYSDTSVSDFTTVNSSSSVKTNPYYINNQHHFANGTGPNGVAYVPGVFNCRLNPAAFKRKKKKPTSFIPVPVPQMQLQANTGRVPNNVEAKMDVPFWKKPLPKDSSELDTSTGSRVNIQQKLQEKKQQQLQELRVIEEEIKQGKLQRPHPTDISEQGTLRQPIPRAKKQPWVPPDVQKKSVPNSRSKTPEVLLTPSYLENARVYYDRADEKWRFMPLVQQPPILDVTMTANTRERSSFKEDNDDGRNDGYYKPYRIPSDLDSQVSLPRSYTLPREFRYHRKPKTRKNVRSEHFVTSTNSSDGDVDSGDENELNGNPKTYRNPQPVASSRMRQPCPAHCNTPGYHLHETKL